MSRDGEAVLERIAAQVELRMAEQSLTQAGVYLRSRGDVSSDTVSRILRARDHRLSKLIALADALGCDVEITLVTRISAPQQRT